MLAVVLPLKLGLSHYGKSNMLRVFENRMPKKIFGPKRGK